MGALTFLAYMSGFCTAGLLVVTIATWIYDKFKNKEKK